MWKSIFKYVVLIAVVLRWSTTASLSDKRLCADHECQTVISVGVAKINYQPSEEGVVALRINSPIRILSKSAGSNLEWWGVEVSGRKGYAPKEFIMEKKIFVKEAELIEVPVVQPKAAPSVDLPPAPLRPSEEPMGVNVAATTTQPLETVVNTDQLTLSAVAQKTEGATPKPAETVKRMEFIEGTQIPVMDELPAVGNKPNDISGEDSSVDVDEDDDDIDDEYEDEEEADVDDDDNDNDDGFLEQQLKKDRLNKLNKQSNVKSAEATLETLKPFQFTEVLAAEAVEAEVANNGTEDAGPKSNAVSEDTQSHNGTTADSSVDSAIDGKVPLSVEPTTVTKDSDNENPQQTDRLLDNKAAEQSKELEDAAPTPAAKSSEENEGPQQIENLLDNKAVVESNVSEDVPPNVPTATPAAVESSTANEVREEINAAPTKGNTTDDEVVGPSAGNETDSSLSTESISEDSSNNVKPEITETGTKVAESSVAYDLHPKTAELPKEPTPLDTATDSNEPLTSSEEQRTVAESSTASSIPLTPADDVMPSPPAQIAIDSNMVSVEATANSAEANSIEDTSTESLPRGAAVDTTSTESAPSTETDNQSAENVAVTEPTLPSVASYDREVDNSVEETTTASSEPAHTTPTHITESDHFYPNADVPIEETTVSPIVQPSATDYVQQVPLQPDQPAYQPLYTLPEDSSTNAPEHFGSQYDTQPQYAADQYQPASPSPQTSDIPAERESEQQQQSHLDPVALPTQSMPPTVEGKGLFGTIMETVNSFISTSNKKDVNTDASVEDMDLQRILFPDKVPHTAPPANELNTDDGYCEKLSPHHCPLRDNHHTSGTGSSSGSGSGDCPCNFSDLTMDNFAQILLSKMLGVTDLLAYLGITAACVLVFLFGYYCFYSSSKEGVLLSRLNMLERSLLATHKENAILKHDLVATRNKLSCIEDNSFGCNDMVVSLKEDLVEELSEKKKLKQQISHLEKELENAAEAGLELNKIVSELLNNQTGDESIISSVEELQRQLNEQQNTILEINANLAEKSRENSELQLMIAEQNARMGGEIASLQQDNDELDAEKSNLQTRIEEMKIEFEEDITRALEGKNFEIKRLQNEIVDLNTKYEDEHTKRQTGQAKIEALEECLKALKRDPSVNVKQIIDVANVRAELLDMQKKLAAAKEKLDVETDGRRLAEDKLNAVLGEGEKFKQDYHQSEKDKLEAQTRLEVLSNYFKEKETQLQKELSLKEAMWLKQQGEAVSTVDRLTTMQDEIQSLKSQNDSLRAEIEAQLAAHKAHTGTLENRAHETWLALRQAERRHEEARTEATALRRKLTALVGGGAGAGGIIESGKGVATGDLNNAPSPIPMHLESPGSPLLGRMPPPPFLPPPFMGPPPPFLGMPPPFVPPGEMRPPPLGRMMSPPPVGGVASRLRSGGRYTPPDHVRYDDYDDDDDDEDDVDDDEEDEEDDEEDEKEMQRQRRRRRRNSGDSWRRNSFSPPPRSYRSHSPADSRYNDRDLISTYDAETDFSPPPSPHGRGSGSRGVYSSHKPYSPPPTESSPIVSESNNARKKKKRQAFSSDSEKSRYSSQR